MSAPHPAAHSSHIADDLERTLDAASIPHLSRGDVPRELLAPATAVGLVRMALEEWGFIAILWLLVAAAPRWMYPVFAFALGGRFHALACVLHDAVHMPLRRKTAAVRVVEVLCGYPIGSTVNAMRYHHLRHHRDSGMPTDPYFRSGRQNVLWWTVNLLRGLLLVPFWTVRAFLGAIALFVVPLRNVYAHVFLQDRTTDDLRNSPEIVECAREEWGQVVFQSVVIAAAIAFPGPVLWGYVVPVIIAGVLAARRVLIEHVYERVADRRIDTIIATTNDHHLRWAGLLGLAPRNAGYHIVHHIHPQVGLGALPRLRDWYARMHPTLYPQPRR